MKYLDAQKEAGKDPKKSVLPKGENKMLEGNRLDQKDPQSLISSPHGTPKSDKPDKSDKADLVQRPGSGVNHKPSHEVTALAKELHVNLAEVKGSGPNGQITEEDVRSAAK